MPNIRANYMSCFDYYQTSPSEYHLSINDFFTEVANYRLNLNNYIEPPPVVAPIQSIDIPNENEWFWSDAPEFELSLIETNLNKLWYNINEIAINFSCTSTGTLNQTIWDLLDDGKVTIKFHALDNFGIQTCEKMEIYKDATEPNTLLEFIPYKNNDIVNDSTVFSFIIDDSNGSGVYRTFYKINDGDWINYSESFTLANLDPGYYVISFYSTDKVGNIEALKYIMVELTDDLLQDNNLQPNPAIGSYNIILILMLFASISIITFARQVKKSRFDRFS